MSQGILYISGDDEYYEEALRSANSARAAMPEVRIGIISTTTETDPVFDISIQRDLACSFADKVRFLAASPFDRTLFVDTDTFFCRPIRDVFSLLDRFDLAAAHAPDRETREVAVPRPFAEFNTGVIAYRLSDAVREFLRLWEETYDTLRRDREIVGDQPSFRKALYESELRINTLPPEFNCRSIFPGYLYDDAAIIHGRHDDMAAVAATLNGTGGMRAHYAWDDRVSVVTNGPNTLIERLQAVVDGYLG